MSINLHQKKFIMIAQMWGQKAADVIKRFSLFLLLTNMFFNTYGQQRMYKSILLEPEFNQYTHQENNTAEDDSMFYFKTEVIKNYAQHKYLGLEHFLTNGIPLIRNHFGRGIFMFRVNKKGKIDFVDYLGNVNKRIEKKIKSNIYKTEGKWIIPKKNDTPPFRYFIFLYHSIDHDHGQNNMTSVNFDDEISILYFIQSQIRKGVNQKNSIIYWLPTITDYPEWLKHGIPIEDPNDKIN